MSRDEIKKAVFEAITEVQQLIGSEVVELDENIIPRFHLMKFDSHVEVTTTVALEIKLDLEIGGSNRLFIDTSSNPISLRDVIDRLYRKKNKIRRKRQIK